MKERWLPVVGYEGLYEVSSEGRVRSLDQVIVVHSKSTYRKRVIGRVLRGGLTRGGYRSITLPGGTCRVARLVLLAFRGAPPSSKHEAAHLNGVRTEDRLGNLQWKTKQANEADKQRHGTAQRGSKHYAAKMTERTVLAVGRRAAKGESFAHIARTLGQGYRRVYDAGTGRKWAHV